LRDAAWSESVEIRRGFDDTLATFLADALRHPLTGWEAAFRVGRVAGALRTSLALPCGRGVGETLHYRLKEAHAINRRSGYPCGCGHLKACTVDGVDARAVLLFVARDVGLGLDEDAIEFALQGVAPRTPSARPRAADYDREGLDRAIIGALTTDGDDGMTTAEVLELLRDNPDATSARIGARLSLMKRDGVVTDWTFDDGGT
jgi:hypothetical protein